MSGAGKLAAGSDRWERLPCWHGMTGPLHERRDRRPSSARSSRVPGSTTIRMRMVPCTTDSAATGMTGPDCIGSESRASASSTGSTVGFVVGCGMNPATESAALRYFGSCLQIQNGHPAASGQSVRSGSHADDDPDQPIQAGNPGEPNRRSRPVVPTAKSAPWQLHGEPKSSPAERADETSPGAAAAAAAAVGAACSSARDHGTGLVKSRPKERPERQAHDDRNRSPTRRRTGAYGRAGSQIGMDWAHATGPAFADDTDSSDGTGRLIQSLVDRWNSARPSRTPPDGAAGYPVLPGHPK